MCSREIVQIGGIGSGVVADVVDEPGFGMIVDHRFSRAYQHGQVELWGGLFWCYSLHISLDTSARSAYRLKTSCTAKQTQQTIIKRSHTKSAGKADRCVKKGGAERKRTRAKSCPLRACCANTRHDQHTHCLGTHSRVSAPPSRPQH